MSQAPVRRKSRQALAAASRKPAPHLVVLRVKRKRGDDPVESLVVSTDEGTSSENKGMPDRKRRAPGGTGFIEETMAGLSLDKTAEQQQHQQQQRQQQQHEVQPPKRLFYKRVRTTEPDGSGDRKKERRPAPVAAATSTGGGGTKSGGGGRLDALLSSRGLGPLGALSLSPRPAAALDFMEVRRVKARAVGHVQANSASAEGLAGLGGREQRTASPSTGVAAGTGAADFHVIDLQAVGRRDGDHDHMDTSGTGAGGVGGAVEGGVAAEKRRAAPILSPGERQMDEAIFKAFQTGDLSSLRGLLTTCSPATPAGVNYRRRLGDGTTALMAAAFHGDLDTIRHLLSLGAKASLIDAGGKSAAMFTGMRGHRECFAELQRVADEEEKEERARKTKRRGSAGGGGEGAAGDDGLDFVYDLYYFEPSASISPTEGAPASGGGEATRAPTSSGKIGERASDGGGGAPPVVRLSGIGPVDENAVGTTADVELEFEHDSDWSDLGDGDDGEDPDSNSEGYYGNDYPEDEGDEDDGACAAPYIYGAGSGSSCASENGSSSSGGGGFDSDSDIEQYSRRVVHMMPDDEHGVPGGGFGAAEEADSTFHAGLGNAGVFAWEPKRSNMFK